MGTMRPMRVLKGKVLSGHMGVETTTIQNLEIVDINLNDNYILVSGNVPGAKKSLVLIRSAVKGGEKGTFELVTYEEPALETETQEVEEINNAAEEVKPEETVATENSTEEEK